MSTKFTQVIDSGAAIATATRNVEFSPPPWATHVRFHWRISAVAGTTLADVLQTGRTSVLNLADSLDALIPEATLRAAGFGTAEVAEIMRVATAYGNRGRGTLGAEVGEGLASKQLVDMPQWQTDYNARLAEFNAAPPGTVTLPKWQDELLLNRRAAGLPDEFAPVADYLPASLNPYPGSEGWARVPRRELGTASQFERSRDDVFRGIQGGRARINELAADPRLSGLARTLAPDDVVRELAVELGGGLRLGQIPLNSPIYDQARELGDLLGKLRPEAQQGLFNLDWLGNVKARELDSARRIASARSVMQTVDPTATGFVRGVGAFQADGTPYVRVSEFLDRMGLTGTNAVTGNPMAKETVAGLLGINTAAKDWMRQLDGFAIPTDVARDVARMGAAWNVPEALAPIVGAWDGVTNLFKGAITAPFPAFHGRNLMSGIFNMWRDSVPMADVVGVGAEMLRIQRGGSLSAGAAARLYPGLTPEAATHQLVQEMMAGRVSFTRNTQVADTVGGSAVKWGTLARDMPDVGGAVRPLGDDAAAFGRTYLGLPGGGTNWNPMGVAGIGERTMDTFAPVAGGRKLGNAVEDWLRGTHYLSKRLGGEAPEAAKFSVMKYQLDYAAMTEFERNVMKRLFPFYAFSRRNLPPLLDDLAQRPAKLAGALRLATGSRTEGEFVPPWVAEGSSVRIPGAPDGKSRFLSSFGLPFEDEGVKALGALAQGNVRRVFQHGFGMAQPLAKLPAEIGTARVFWPAFSNVKVKL